MRTAKQLKHNLEVIQADNKKKLEALDVIYYDRLVRKLDLTQIKRDIEQAKTIAERSEELAAKALKIAEDRESAQAQAVETARQKVSAEIDAGHKKTAQADFLAKGGSLAEFEILWPAIRAKMLVESAVEKTVSPEKRAPIITGM